MNEFALYMLFSSIEYFAIFVIIFGVFNMSFRFYLKEIIVGSLITTLFSFLLVKINMHNVLPIPLILIPFTVFILVKYFKEKLSRSISITIGGFIIYMMIQYLIGTLLVSFGFAEQSDLLVPFSILTYKAQLLCATISIIISLFLIATNSGFGFMLLPHILGVKKFVLINIVIAIICGSVCIALYLSESMFMLLIGLLTVSISTVAICIISYKRDMAEFSLQR